MVKFSFGHKREVVFHMKAMLFTFILLVGFNMPAQSYESGSGLFIFSPVEWYSSKTSTSDTILAKELNRILAVYKDEGFLGKALTDGHVERVEKCKNDKYLVEVFLSKRLSIVYTDLEDVYIRENEKINKGKRIGLLEEDHSYIVMVLKKSTYEKITQYSSNEVYFSIAVDTLVFSPLEGEVNGCGYSVPNGQWLDIKSAYYLLSYSYLRQILLPKKSAITQGQKIAFSGMTGDVDEPSLCFTIKQSTDTKIFDWIFVVISD